MVSRDPTDSTLRHIPIVVLLVQEALERRETTAKEQLQVAKLTLSKNVSRQGLSLGEQFVVTRGIAGDEVLEDTSVGWVRHGGVFGGVRGGEIGGWLKRWEAVEDYELGERSPWGSI